MPPKRPTLDPVTQYPVRSSEDQWSPAPRSAKRYCGEYEIFAYTNRHESCWRAYYQNEDCVARGSAQSLDDAKAQADQWIGAKIAGQAMSHILPWVTMGLLAWEFANHLAEEAYNDGWDRSPCMDQ